MYTLSFEANFGKVFEDFTWIQLYWQFLSSLVFFVKSKMSSGKITILFRFFRFFSWNHPKKTFLQFPNCKNSVKSNDLFLTVWKLLTESQCGNYVNSFSYFFGKDFVKAKVLIKLLNSWFHGIFFRWENFSFFHTATFISQNFRQINVLLKNLTVNQFDEKNVWQCAAFLVFPHCAEFYCHIYFAEFPSNQRFTKDLYCKSIWRKKCVAVNFSFFHTVFLEILLFFVIFIL